ncbi:M16 peptidase-like protein [Aureococcus anophagefferens]|nr:M16 peptidase-like protein [Aureococcus anophagefferens]
MASAETQKRDRAMSWEDKEAAAVKELVASLPAWEVAGAGHDPTLRVGAADGGDCGLATTTAQRRAAGPRRARRRRARRSIDERDEERGLAHVLEHLAFSAQSGEAGPGACCGARGAAASSSSHQNAYTSFEETCYWLHVPSDFFGRALELLGALRARAFGSRVLQRSPRRNPKLRVNVYEDAEATSTAATLSCCRPAVARRRSVASGVLLDGVYQQILNRRLQKLSMLATPPFAHASAGTERPVCLAASGAVSVATLSVQPLTRGDAAQALAAAWRCVEDTRAGVSEEELRMAKREILSDLKMQWLEKDQQETPAPRALVRAPARLDAAEAGAAATADALRGAVLDRGRRDRSAAEAFAAAFFGPVADEQGQVVSKARHDLPGLATPALELRLDNGLTVVFLRTDFATTRSSYARAAPGGLSTVCGRSATLTPLAFAARFASSLAREYGPFGAPKALPAGVGAARYAKAIDEVNTRDHLLAARVPRGRGHLRRGGERRLYDAAFSSPEGFALCFGAFGVSDGALEELVKAYLGPLRPRGRGPARTRPSASARLGALPAFGARRSLL